MGLDTSLTEEHPPEDWLGKIDLGHDEKCTDEEKAEAPEKKWREPGPNTRSTAPGQTYFSEAKRSVAESGRARSAPFLVYRWRSAGKIRTGSTAMAIKTKKYIGAIIPCPMFQYVSRVASMERS
jgi:hypothetical protein